MSPTEPPIYAPITSNVVPPAPAAPRFDIGDGWTCEFPDFVSVAEAAQMPEAVLCSSRNGFVMQEYTP